MPFDPSSAVLDEQTQFDPSSAVLDEPVKQPEQKAGLPGYQKTEEKIASRPDMLKSYVEETKHKPTGFREAFFQPYTAAYKLIGGLGQRGEAAVANLLMGIQEGKISIQDALKGIKGERLGEIGDIPRRAGVNEPASTLIGLGATAGLGELATTGKLAPKVLSQSPIKTAQQAGKEIGDISRGVMSGIKTGTKSISKFVGNIANRSKASYITDEVAPQAQRIFQESVDNFTPHIENYARKELKIPESAIATIKKEGVNKIKTSVENLTTDDVVQRIQQGFENKKTLADNAYSSAIENFKSPTIKTPEFYQTIQRGLRTKGWIDLQGNPTARYKNGLDPVMDKLTDMYMDLKNLPVNRGARTTGQIMSKEDFSTYRDALGSMLKEKPSDTLVMQARNALYNSAEKSGMTGIKAARNLESKSFLMQKRFLDSQGNIKALGREGNLNKFHKLSQEQIRQLQEIENYTGEKFIGDLKTVTAKQYIDKIEQGKKLENFVNDFDAAMKRSKTNFIMKEYSKVLGPENALKIKNEIIAARRAGIVKKGAYAVGGIGATAGVGAIGKKILDLTH